MITSICFIPNFKINVFSPKSNFVTLSSGFSSYKNKFSLYFLFVIFTLNYSPTAVPNFDARQLSDQLETFFVVIFEKFLQRLRHG